MSNLTQQQLKEALGYNPETGVFTSKSGKIVGHSRKGDGYILVRIGRKLYLGHRLAWLYVHGDIPDSMWIDHIDCDKRNNIISNLRLSTPSENGQNRRQAEKESTSTYLGVSWNNQRRKWVAQIGVNKKTIALGRFNTPEQAQAAYLAAKKRLHPFQTIT